MRAKMQGKQTKIDNADVEVNQSFNPNDYSSKNISTNDAPLESLIDYSFSRFNNLANADVKMGLQSGSNPSALPDDEQADSNAVGQINLSPNAACQITNQTVESLRRGRPDITFFDRLQIAARFFRPERAWGEVTQLARQYNLSRESIYNISYRIQSLLSAPPVRRPPVIDSPVTFGCQLFTPQEMLNLRMRLILTSVFPGGVTMR
jgi:hypothetical protein